MQYSDVVNVACSHCIILASMNLPCGEGCITLHFLISWHFDTLILHSCIPTHIHNTTAVHLQFNLELEVVAHLPDDPALFFDADQLEPGLHNYTNYTFFSDPTAYFPIELHTTLLLNGFITGSPMELNVIHDQHFREPLCSPTLKLYRKNFLYKGIKLAVEHIVHINVPLNCDNEDNDDDNDSDNDNQQPVWKAQKLSFSNHCACLLELVRVKVSAQNDAPQQETEEAEEADDNNNNEDEGNFARVQMIQMQELDNNLQEVYSKATKEGSASCDCLCGVFLPLFMYLAGLLLKESDLKITFTQFSNLAWKLGLQIENWPVFLNGKWRGRKVGGKLPFEVDTASNTIVAVVHSKAYHSELQSSAEDASNEGSSEDNKVRSSQPDHPVNGKQLLPLYEDDNVDENKRMAAKSSPPHSGQRKPVSKTVRRGPGPSRPLPLLPVSPTLPADKTARSSPGSWKPLSLLPAPRASCD
ncbi:hypothetical protein GYMLUDRAFT_59342 [Collybiopsis luxurians FD-317 M1]|uniref:Uncharacterized protein n=1 Tax=Collybiopsis luxurians FD-317 M1 TaxID=944289 RepID=A0A0D0BXW4_9AGAR|nr:hypothetical protein GYMLUDRAFT_59342 [Collybiopsis luxurians FD-317 M1]